MKIASVSENRKIEKRVAITPEITKKYLYNGFQVSLSKDYGEHLGFKDTEYKEMGANIIEDEKKIINDAKCGYAGEAEDVESLIKNIKDFIKLTENEKKRMGLNAREYVVRHFKKEHILDSLNKEILSLLN